MARGTAGQAPPTASRTGHPQGRPREVFSPNFERVYRPQCWITNIHTLLI